MQCKYVEHDGTCHKLYDGHVEMVGDDSTAEQKYCVE